jgi:PAS domain S-box-containing protein
MIPIGAHAVVVNDDPGQLRLISGLLQRYGMEVDSYLRPELAIRELQLRGPVDLLVLDLHMPVLDGWKFCRLVRSEEFKGFEKMPILVVSATFSGAEVEEVSAQIGANAFLPVPFAPEVFRRYVEDLLEGRKPLYIPNVLIVDDDPAVRGTVGKIFENAGYRVHLAVDGREGGSVYRRIRPDLVILDYHLPDLTGASLLESIKRPGDPAVVLVVTGDSDPDIATTVLRKGADGYVRKPFDAKYLVDLAHRARRERSLLRVEELLELRTQELRSSEERYKNLFATIPEAIIIADREGCIVQSNEVAERILGRKGRELVGVTLRELVTGDQIPSLIESLGQAWKSGEGEFETQLMSGRGEVRDFEVSARTVEFQRSRSLLLIARDSTDRRAMEEEREKLQVQIQHAQKLESLGVMAGGIAHDFNNLLVGILGNASLVLMDLEEDHPAREFVEQIDLASRRAAELTGQILTYSGKSKASFEMVGLGELVREMNQLIEPAVSKKATLRLDILNDLPRIEADPAQLRQVVMNLILNASDSLEGESGSVGVRVRSLEVGRDLLLRSFVGQDLPTGLYVALEVSDSGCGMDSETLARIFDPFFTTKFTGRGLGLASSLGIVRGHHGAVLVQSKKGKGTTFQLLFPALEEVRSEGVPSEVPSIPLKVPPSIGDRGCVLIVDDEPAVRRLASATLERAGFTSILTEDGEEGLRSFRERRGDIDAVLLDLTMPGMDGREVLVRIREIDPGMPVILSSGFSEDQVLNGIGDGTNTTFLRKPYLPSSLQEMMTKLTGRCRGSGARKSDMARRSIA